METTFVETSAPNNTEITRVLVNAAPMVSGFDIETSSIIVNDIRKQDCVLLDQKF